MSAFTAVERLAEPIGFDIGQSNSKVQADLLNGLVRGLVGGGIDHFALDSQCAYISQDLDPRAKRLLVRLAAFCEQEGDR